MDTETRDLLNQIIVGMDAGFARVDERFAQVDGRFASLQTEMREGFRSVGDRLTSLQRDVAALWAETRAHGTAMTGLFEHVSSLTGHVASLTEHTGGLEKRVDSMSDDMRQRFRVVVERLAALEHSPG